MYDVLCIAGTNCDLIFAKLKQFPMPAKEVECEDFLIKAGGGANTPLGLAKLGTKTAFATELGKDVLGEIIFKELEKSGVDMSAVLCREDIRTSVSAVLSMGEERGFATYLLDGMANITAEYLEPFIAKASHIHTYVGYCNKYPIIETAKKYNKTVSLDATWIDGENLDHLKPILSGCEIFMPNEPEACRLAGTDDVEEALEKIGRYPGITVIKRGSKGSIARQGDKVVSAPALKGIPVVDTTGAGDLFCAGFIHGYLKGWELEEALRFANVTGGLGVTFYGGMDASFTLERVLRCFEKEKEGGDGS